MVWGVQERLPQRRRHPSRDIRDELRAVQVKGLLVSRMELRAVKAACGKTGKSWEGSRRGWLG